MLLGGLQKTTLIDFPGRVACTVFTVGCNFHCPFCHNKDLVSLANFKNSGIDSISEDYFFEFLKKRKKILDGVCITGGEPSINADLPEFCRRIKELGLEVKVDTNGSNPGMLEKLIKGHLVDFVAMDVKTQFENYSQIAKVKSPHFAEATLGAQQKSKVKSIEQNSKLIKKIKKSIGVILESGAEYEFRTTVVPGIHDRDVMIKLARDLKILGLRFKVQSSRLNWVLQKFRPQNCLDPAFLKIKPFTDREMQGILKAVQKILPGTKLR